MTKHSRTSSAPLLAPRTPASASYRESTYLIPTPISKPPRFVRLHFLLGSLPTVAYGSIQQRPYSLEWYWIGITTLLTIGLAIAIQVGLWISQKNDGFAVRQENVIRFASPSFLVSFFPTLLVIPLVYQLREMDFELRYHHPYVILSRGGATASESLLLDYTIGLGWTLYFALKHRHIVIFFSTLAAIGTLAFQPLAGSVFELPLVPFSTKWTTTSTRQIGLKGDVVDDLSAFAASAGYAEAAVYHRLPDPPFVMNGWATAEFTLPPLSSSTNGSLVVNTTGIQTAPNCANPTAPPSLSQGQNSANWVIRAESPTAGCAANVNFDANVADEQHGITNVACLGDSAETDVRFQGVMFWFFHRRPDTSEPESRVVFCRPTIKAFDVQANMNLTLLNLTDVVMRDDYTSPNNVTGDPLNGRAFNAVIFSPSDDTFVQARSLAISSGISGAILRLANQAGQAKWDDPNGFLNATIKVYRQHLSLTAKSVYFVPDDKKIPAEFESMRTRLIFDPLASQLLSILLLVIGITTLAVHLIHYRMRKGLYLTTPPGTMASVVALTSRSGFGEVLLPYDDRDTIKRKLGGWRFGLDGRTGAIVVDSELYGSDVGGPGEHDAKEFTPGEREGDEEEMERERLLGEVPHSARKARTSVASDVL